MITFGSSSTKNTHSCTTALCPAHSVFPAVGVWVYLFDLVLDGELDPAQARPVVFAGRDLVHVSIQNSLHFLSVPAAVQHSHHKVLTLHGELPVVILKETNHS